jgi:hypothetical protein
MRGIPAPKAGIWLVVSAIYLAVALPDYEVGAIGATGLHREAARVGTQRGISRHRVHAGAPGPGGPASGISARRHERAVPRCAERGEGCLSRMPVLLPLMHLHLRGGAAGKGKRVNKRERTSPGGGGGEEGGAPEKEAKRQRPAPDAVEEDVASAAEQPQDSGAAAAAAAPAAPDAAAAGNNTAGREGQKGMPKSKFIGVAIRKSGQFAAVHRKKVVGLYEKEEHAAMAFDLASTSTWGSATVTRGSAKVNFRETPIAAERMREEGKDPMECLEELWERLRGESVVTDEHGTASEIRPETQSQGRYDCACVFLTAWKQALCLHIY